ncbi:hypothetical protein CR513_28699, partial [Mucuna pruriens]
MDSPGSELKLARDERLRESLDPRSPTLVDAKRKVRPHPNQCRTLVADPCPRGRTPKGKSDSMFHYMHRELHSVSADLPYPPQGSDVPLNTDNATLELNNTSESYGQDEGEDFEEEALVEMERLLEQERLKLQSGTKELETFNLSKEEEKLEIRVRKQMSSGFKQRLVELLREYADIFAWSYRDMPGLDTTIMEHKLPLIPNAIPVRQQLRRMKPKVALKIKEEVEKQ